MESLELDELKRDIRSLQFQLRVRIRAIYGCGAVLLLSYLLGAMQRTEPAELVYRSLAIPTPDLPAQVTLTSGQQGGILELNNNAGSPRVVLATNKLGGTALVFNAQSSKQVQLSTLDTGGDLAVLGTTKQVVARVATTEFGGALDLMNPTGTVQVSVTAESQGGRILLANAAGKAGVGASATRVGTETILWNPAGKSVVELRAESERAIVQGNDAEQRPRFQAQSMLSGSGEWTVGRDLLPNVARLAADDPGGLCEFRSPRGDRQAQASVQPAGGRVVGWGDQERLGFELNTSATGGQLIARGRQQKSSATVQGTNNGGNLQLTDPAERLGLSTANGAFGGEIQGFDVQQRRLFLIGCEADGGQWESWNVQNSQTATLGAGSEGGFCKIVAPFDAQRQILAAAHPTGGRILGYGGSVSAQYVIGCDPATGGIFQAANKKGVPQATLRTNAQGGQIQLGNFASGRLRVELQLNGLESGTLTVLDRNGQVRATR